MDKERDILEDITDISSEHINGFDVEIIPRTEGFGMDINIVTTDTLGVQTDPRYYQVIKDVMVRLSRAKRYKEPSFRKGSQRQWQENII